MWDKLYYQNNKRRILLHVCTLHVSKYFVSINTSVDYMIKDDDKNNRSTYPHLNNLDMRDIVEMCSGMSFPESFNF